MQQSEEEGEAGSRVEVHAGCYILESHRGVLDARGGVDVDATLRILCRFVKSSQAVTALCSSDNF